MSLVIYEFIINVNNINDSGKNNLNWEKEKIFYEKVKENEIIFSNNWTKISLMIAIWIKLVWSWRYTEKGTKNEYRSNYNI